jgi:cbb3-type cytochrome oxidase subunit 1
LGFETYLGFGAWEFGIFEKMRPARLERATYSFGGCHSIQLSYGRSVADYSGRARKHNRAVASSLFVIVLALLLVIDLLPLPFDHEYEHEYEESDLSFCISTLPA